MENTKQFFKGIAIVVFLGVIVLGVFWLITPRGENAAEPGITMITIDGSKADWADYPATGQDEPAGDQHSGTPDLGNTKAFYNDQYFYLFIEILQDGGGIDHYFTNVTLANDITVQINMWPDTGVVEMRNPISSLGVPIETQIVKGPDGIEIKVALSLMGADPVSYKDVRTFEGIVDPGDVSFGGNVYDSKEVEP